MTIVRGLLGLVFFCLVAWGLSSDRRRFPWRIVIFGLVLHAILVAWVALRLNTWWWGAARTGKAAARWRDRQARRSTPPRRRCAARRPRSCS